MDAVILQNCFYLLGGKSDDEITKSFANNLSCDDLILLMTTLSKRACFVILEANDQTPLDEKRKQHGNGYDCSCRNIKDKKEYTSYASEGEIPFSEAPRQRLAMAGCCELFLTWGPRWPGFLLPSDSFPGFGESRQRCDKRCN